MPVSLTARNTSNPSTSSAQTRTTGSFTPSANCRLVVFAIGQVDSTTSFSTPSWSISDSIGSSWTSIASASSPQWGSLPSGYNMHVAAWYTDIGTSPSARTITVDADSGGGLSFFYAVHTFEVTGYNTGGWLAQAAVTNNARINPESNSASGTLTLGSAPSASNMTVGMFGVGADGAGTPSTPSGTSVLASSSATYTPFGVFYREATTQAMQVGDLGQTVGNWAGIIIEIAAASGGPTPQSVSGTMGSLTGVPTKSPRKSLTGVAGSLTASIVKSPRKTLAGVTGSVSSTLASSLTFLQSLSGTAGNIVGALANRANKALEGTLGTVAGTVARLPQLSLAGTLGTATGTISKLTSISFAGVSGALTGALNSSIVFLQSLTGVLGSSSTGITIESSEITTGSGADVTLDLPSGLVATDTLLVFATVPDGITPSGMSLVAGSTGFKIYSGTGFTTSSTIVIDFNGSSGDAVIVSYRISGADSVSGTMTTGNSIDPPEHSVAGDLFFAAISYAQSSTTVNGTPANYTGLINEQAGVGSFYYIATAHRVASLSSDNPSTYSLTNSPFFSRAATVSVLGEEPSAGLTGAVSLVTQKSLTGVAGTVSGLITRLTNINLSGAQGVISGALSTSIGLIEQAVTGVLGAVSGALSMATSVTRTGATGNMSGTQTRSISTSLAGVTGALTGTVSYIFTFLISLGGTVGNLTGTVSRAITFTASLTGTAGAMTGAIVKRTYYSVAGITGDITGVSTRFITKSFTGTLGALTGALSSAIPTVYLKTVEGTLGVMTGTVTFVQVIRNAIIKGGYSIKNSLAKGGFAIKKKISGGINRWQ